MLALGALSAPPAVGGQVMLTTDAGVFNAYVWRGVSLTNQIVLQPDAYLSIPAGGGSAVIGVWGSIDAGRYDGPLGVLAALAVLERLWDRALPFAVEVIGFADEEGVRFGTSFLGSSAVAGRFAPAWRHRRRPSCHVECPQPV